MLGELALAALMAICSAGTAALGQTASANNRIPPGTPTISVYVLLEGPPAALAAGKSTRPVALAQRAAATRQRGLQIQRQQAALEPLLAAGGAQITARFSRLLNAVKVRIPVARVKALESLPGVVGVRRARHYWPSRDTSVPFIGAPVVWERLAANGVHVDGAGVRIGIVDSGIDYSHADFGGSGRLEDFDENDPTRIEPGSFPTAKVVGGYDFAGTDYNSADDDRAVPVPDPDPLDCYQSGHGTHVAGIAAGLGVLTNDLGYTGSYAAPLGYRQFGIAPGVAPRALLYALKVFGCTGSTDLVGEALEWAADPNGDYDFSDRLEVVNLSLGSDFSPVNGEDAEQLALNRLVELGCVVVAAAGNGGSTFYVVGAPGVAQRAIAVANSFDDGLLDLAIEITGPATIAGRYSCVEGEFTKPLWVTGDITGEIVYVAPPLACDDLLNASDLQGNIALIDRGTCFFVDKIAKVQAAGAIAVIMVNRVDGPPIIMGGDSLAEIPGVMISKADGAILKNHLSDGVTATLGPDLITPRLDLADQLAESSSRGPGAPNIHLKPDLAAPGTDIRSASAGQGADGVSLSGTSMATPHVTGAVALLRQLHPGWTPEEIKAALMNTAGPMKDETANPYPQSRIGAGRVRPALAAQTRITMAAENANGGVSLSFGSLVLTAVHQETRNVRFTNHGDTDVTGTLVVSNTIVQPGFTLTPQAISLTVPAHGSTNVPLALVADPSQFDLAADPTTPDTVDNEPRQFIFEASGEVWFLNPDLAVHLPYYAVLRPASDFSLGTNRLDLSAGPGAKQITDVSLPLQGATVNPNPVVSAFQLGVTSADTHFANPLRASSDLLAVGAASDFARSRSFINTTIYFGVATAGPWTTPQLAMVELAVKIDLDGDGKEDFKLSNGDSDPAAPAPTDVLKTYVLDVAADTTETSGYLNVYAADQLDTSPFNNSVAVLSAPAAALGLSAANPRFRYRVMTSSPGTLQDEETPWILFDAAHPAADTTAFGLGGTPFFDDGLPVKIRLDRASAADTAQRLPGVLLLHHHNLQARRFEVVRLDLSKDDSDADGLPDWWEQQHFGNLTTANQDSDTDGDGFNDLAEFRAGTDPKDAQSLLRLSASPVANGVKLSWPGVTGKYYTLERASDLILGFAHTLIAGLPDQPPVNSFTDTNASGRGPFFYRLKLD